MLHESVSWRAGYTETVSSGNTKLDIPFHLRSSQGLAMGYLNQLALLRKKRGLTQAGLAERLGVEQPTVQRWEKGKREPDLGQLHQIAKALGVEVSALLGQNEIVPLGPQLTLRGEVAAGVWVEAAEWPSEDWQTFTGRADVTVPDEFRFGLRVVGDSMSMVYPEGTILECVSVFGGAEPIPGRRVIVVRENDRQEYEATVKELVEQEGELWLVPRSYNPSHQPFRLAELEEGVVEQRITAVVVSSIRPE